MHLEPYPGTFPGGYISGVRQATWHFNVSADLHYFKLNVPNPANLETQKETYERFVP